MSFFSFGVLTNKMIKQEVSVTNCCKHVHQSLIPTELPPGAVMGNKMEKQSKFPRCSTAAPLLCRQNGQKAAEFHPPLLGSVLTSLQSPLLPPFIQGLAQLDPLTFTFAVAMTK